MSEEGQGQTIFPQTASPDKMWHHGLLRLLSGFHPSLAVLEEATPAYSQGNLEMATLRFQFNPAKFALCKPLTRLHSARLQPTSVFGACTAAARTTHRETCEKRASAKMPQSLGIVNHAATAAEPRHNRQRCDNAKDRRLG